MMGDDSAILIGAPLVFTAIGIALAATLKKVRKRADLPTEPILLFLAAGVVVTIVRLLEMRW